MKLLSHVYFLVFLLQAEAFIRERLGRTITVNECTGPVTTFIVEPFMPHKEEMYMCIQVSASALKILV